MRVNQRGYVRVIEREDGQILFQNLDRLRPDMTQARHDQARLMGNDQGSLTSFKIEYLRLGFPFRKPSLRDSSLNLAYVASTWSTLGN